MRKIISLAALLLLATVSYAQFLLNPQERVKTDSALVIGRLDNGLTYYIRKNANPEKRAEFYIATNVGAIQETPAQRGLAHFLEHMCFNGNRDFEGNSMMSYLEKNGLVFGRNINAMTGVESTVYTLNAIPTTRKALVDTALVILQNDAAFVTNDPAEIEKERGVIIEEWRSGNTAQRRQQEQLFKVLFKGTKYADCNVIGDEASLLSFDPQELVNFYKTWYYPANQAIIVAGDVDVEYVEAKIKEIFSVIPKKEVEPVKEEIEVPGNENPDYMIFTDPELTQRSLMIIIKQPKLLRELNNTGFAVLNNMKNSYISMMMQERLTDASKVPGAAFASPESAVISLNNSVDGLFVAAMVNDKATDALEGIVRVLRQIKMYGFTQGEFDRAKAKLLRSYQSSADAAATRVNRAFAMACVQNFIDNSPVADPVYLNEVVKEYGLILNLDAINKAVSLMIRPSDNVIVYAGPQKEGENIPTEEDLVNSYDVSHKCSIEPLADETVDESLIDETSLAAGAIVKSEKGYLGTEVLTLSNGIKVYLYPNDLRKDNVSFVLRQDGGKSILPSELLPGFENNVRSFISQNGGVSKFSQSKLDKILAGKAVRVSAGIDDISSTINANCSSKDIETMLQLVYLNFTEPRCDPEEFSNSYAQLAAIAGNIESSPAFQFQKTLNGVLNNDSPRAVIFGADMLKSVSAENIAKGNAILFGNADGAKVFIGGDFNAEEIKPLVARYIASLPVVKDGSRRIVDHNLKPKPGAFERIESMKMQNPNVYAAVVYTGKCGYDKEELLRMRAMSYILEMRYISSLREEEGGTYSPSVGGNITPLPEPTYFFGVTFETQLEKSEKLIGKVYAGIESLAADGPTAEELAKTVEMLKKQIPENEKDSSYWMGLIRNYYTYGIDTKATAEDIDKYVTLNSVRELAAKIVKDNNRATVVLNPEK